MPDSTKELVDAGQVGTLLMVLSGIALALTAVLGAMSRGRPLLLRGALLAGGAVFAYPLWLVYNGIEDHFGLDSVAALLINFGLFVVVGVMAGLALRRWWPTEDRELAGPSGDHAG